MSQAIRSVVITGASRGIGHAIAADLAIAGLAVYAPPRSLWDISLPPPPVVSQRVADLEGPIALVHCAAILGPVGPVATAAPVDWIRTLTTDLGGAFRACRLVLPRMLKDSSGRIVLFAGGGACEGRPRFSAYACAKAGVVRLAETLALEVAAANVWVTAIAPGAVETDMLAACRAVGDSPSQVVEMAEPMRLVRRLLTEDCEHLSGRLVHSRDIWTAGAAMSSEVWKLRRIL